MHIELWIFITFKNINNEYFRKCSKFVHTSTFTYTYTQYVYLYRNKEINYTASSHSLWQITKFKCNKWTHKKQKKGEKKGVKKGSTKQSTRHRHRHRHPAPTPGSGRATDHPSYTFIYVCEMYMAHYIYIDTRYSVIHGI